MKRYVVFCLLISNVCLGQNWAGEIMAGGAWYNGDLTQSLFSFKRVKPAASVSVKYVSGDFLDFKISFAVEKIGAKDADNASPFLRARNLSFQTLIEELSASFEFNLFDPQVYNQYPYLFAGVGIFYFNPYTIDDNGQKTYLRPLSTEGEGLAAYPGRKMYSLVQPCIPFGFGFKTKLNKTSQLSFEFGCRFLFTDYLDDVSKTYISLEALDASKGPEAVALAYRKIGVPFSEEGFPRGNSKIRDYYFFSGLKYTFAFKAKK